jgi:hypothetical protein
MTLAAAAAQQDRFVQTKAARSPSAPPLFVLDRNRLAPYTDEATQFDNRSLARLPNAAWFMARGIKRVLYVAPNNATVIDSDDVNEDLLSYVASGVDVRAVRLGDYHPSASANEADEAAAAFAAHYGLAETKTPSTAAPTVSSAWVPTPRSSAFSSGRVSPEPSHSRPVGFGEVPVVVDAATGVMLGALIYQAGSWNQRSGSSYRSRSFLGGG